MCRRCNSNMVDQAVECLKCARVHISLYYCRIQKNPAITNIQRNQLRNERKEMTNNYDKYIQCKANLQ